MTPEPVADPTAELIAVAVAEFLPIVEAFAGPNEDPALPAIACP